MASDRFASFNFSFLKESNKSVSQADAHLETDALDLTNFPLFPLGSEDVFLSAMDLSWHQRFKTE